MVPTHFVAKDLEAQLLFRGVAGSPEVLLFEIKSPYAIFLPHLGCGKQEDVAMTWLPAWQSRSAVGEMENPTMWKH